MTTKPETKNRIMKNTLLLLGALGLLVVTGCNQSSSTTENPPDTNTAMQNAQDTASNAWQDTKSGASNAWQSTKDVATNAYENTKDAATNGWNKTTNAVMGSSTNQ